MRTYKIENNKITFKFEYNLSIIEKIKQIEGRIYFHNSKEWMIPITLQNNSSIQSIISNFSFEEVKKENIKFSEPEYNLIDFIPKLKELNLGLECRSYQEFAVNYMLTYKRVINGDDCGCISGDSLIQVNRAKKGFSITLRDLYYKFNGGKSRNSKWDLSIPTKCKCLNENTGEFFHNKIENVLFKGYRNTLKITLESSKIISLTPDHEVLSKEHGWIAIEKLKIGDIIYSNGEYKCKRCGSNKNIITYKQSKFLGYCKDCMYKYMRINHKKGDYRIDHDGYIMINSQFDRDRDYSVCEHIYVMEQFLGRKLKEDEVVHHIDKNKKNNDILNLQLLSRSEHAKIHSKEKYKNLENNKLILIAKEDRIISIEDGGVKDVYDIIMKNPYRNFVANKIIVHNCGKTVETILACETGNLFPVVIVTLSSVKEHWDKLWKQCNPNRKIEVLYAEKTDYNWSSDVFILNYNLLGKNDVTENEKTDEELKVVIPKFRFTELEKMKKRCAVFDESHFLKSSKSLRGKLAKKLVKDVEYIFGLTGTPILNRPSELIHPITILGRFNELFYNWKSFVYRYCNAHPTRFGLDYNGSSNLKELNDILKKNCYFRREKREVLKDLPDIQKSILNVDISNLKEYRTAENNLIEYIRANYSEMKVESAKMAEFLVLRNILRQLSSKGKIKEIINEIDNFIESTDRKLVIFGIYSETLKKLASHYKAYLIDGNVPGKMKGQIIDDFKTNDDRVLFGNIQALGTGTDGLQEVCSDLWIIDLPERPGDIDQVIGRVDRSGASRGINVNFILSNQTIDLLLWDSIEGKRVVTDTVNRGIEGKVVDFNQMVINKYLKIS